MESFKKIKRHFLQMVSLFALVSVSMLMLPLRSYVQVKNLPVLSIITGSIFWIGLLSGCISFCVLHVRLRRRLDEAIPKKGIPYGLHFFGNRPAVVTDILLIGSLILNLLNLFGFSLPEVVAWIAMIILITTVYLHFVFNSRVGIYVVSNWE